MAELLICDLCKAEMEPAQYPRKGEVGVDLVMFAQSRGLTPRQKSPSELFRTCAPCTGALALGPPPPPERGLLYLKAWCALRGLVIEYPDVVMAGWRKVHNLGAITPPPVVRVFAEPETAVVEALGQSA